MIKKGDCMGYCGDTNVVLYFDPKLPPMDVEPCLCIECAKNHYVEEVERLADEAHGDGIELEFSCE